MRSLKVIHGLLALGGLLVQVALSLLVELPEGAALLGMLVGVATLVLGLVAYTPEAVAWALARAARWPDREAEDPEAEEEPLPVVVDLEAQALRAAWEALRWQARARLAVHRARARVRALLRPTA